MTRAASEISEIEGIDVTEHDDPFLESNTDQQALLDLESELQSNAGNYAVSLNSHSEINLIIYLILY